MGCKEEDGRVVEVRGNYKGWMFFKMDPGPLIGFCLTAITRFLMDFGIVRKIKMAATGKIRFLNGYVDECHTEVVWKIWGMIFEWRVKETWKLYINLFIEKKERIKLFIINFHVQFPESSLIFPGCFVHAVYNQFHCKSFLSCLIS